MKKIFIVKLTTKVKDETISTKPPKGKISEIFPIGGFKRPLNDDEQLFVIESPIMHRMCQVFGWDYSLMLDHEFQK